MIQDIMIDIPAREAGDNQAGIWNLESGTWNLESGIVHSLWEDVENAVAVGGLAALFRVSDIGYQRKIIRLRHSH